MSNSLANHAVGRSLPKAAIFLVELVSILILLVWTDGCRAQSSGARRTATAPSGSIAAQLYAIPESHDGHPFRILSNVPVTSAAAWGNTIVWGTVSGRTAQLVMQRGVGATPTVIYEVGHNEHPWRITSIRGDRNVVAWMEYYQTGGTGGIRYRVCWKQIGEPIEDKTILKDWGAVFSVSDGLIAYDADKYPAKGRPYTTINIYDTAKKTVIETLHSAVVGDSYGGPSISSGRVAFVREHIVKQSGKVQSDIMVYDLANKTLTSLNLGDKCTGLSMAGDKIAYVESAPRSGAGTVYLYDLRTHASRQIWPDARYLSPPEASRRIIAGGMFPSLNSDYVIWTTVYDVILCFDIHQGDVVRFAENGISENGEQESVFGRTASPGYLIWYGKTDGPKPRYFVSGIRLDKGGNPSSTKHSFALDAPLEGGYPG